MNQIPNETLLIILDFLNYDDLLVVKNVSKRFRGAACYLISQSTVWVREDSRCRTLGFRKEEDFTQFSRQFYDFENNQLNKCLISSNWKRFRFVDIYHGNIKKLIVSNPFLINFLNTFYNLIHLEILCESLISKDYYYKFKNDMRLNFENKHSILENLLRGENFRLNPRSEETNSIFLNLNNLKIFYFITNCSSKKLFYVLKCPVLKKMLTDNCMDCFKFEYPESIEDLTCEENSRILSKFRNLKKLTCFYFNHNHPGFLNTLKNLKEFHFYKIDESMPPLKYENIKIYYKNIRYSSSMALQNNLKKLSSTTLNEVSMEFYSKHYKFLDHVGGLMHRELRLGSFRLIEFKLLCLLKNLKVFHIDYDEMDKDNYIEVFNACSLDKLTIRSLFVTIDQNFLDTIPILNPMLTFLKVDDFENIDFIRRLKYLRVMKTEQFFDIMMLKKIFDTLHYLKTVEILIAVDIYKFKLIGDKVTCSYNHDVFLRELKKEFVSPSSHNCIFKLYELFVTNYK